LSDPASGQPDPSPAILEKIGTAFCRAVAVFAEDNPPCSRGESRCRSPGQASNCHEAAQVCSFGGNHSAAFGLFLQVLLQPSSIRPMLSPHRMKLQSRHRSSAGCSAWSYLRTGSAEVAPARCGWVGRASTEVDVSHGGLDETRPLLEKSCALCAAYEATRSHSRFFAIRSTTPPGPESRLGQGATATGPSRRQSAAGRVRPPGCPAPKSALPPGHAGPVTTTECRHAPSRLARPNHPYSAVVGLSRSATRIQGCVRFGRARQPEALGLSRSVVVDPHIASSEQYVDRLVLTAVDAGEALSVKAASTIAITAAGSWSPSNSQRAWAGACAASCCA